MYDVRAFDTKITQAKPEDRGRLVAQYPSYREAFREWQRRNAKGENVYVIRSTEQAA